MIVQDRKKVPGLALYLYERAKDSSGEIPDTTRRITVYAKLIEKFPQTGRHQDRPPGHLPSFLSWS